MFIREAGGICKRERKVSGWSGSIRARVVFVSQTWAVDVGLPSISLPSFIFASAFFPSGAASHQV